MSARRAMVTLAALALGPSCGIPPTALMVIVDGDPTVRSAMGTLTVTVSYGNSRQSQMIANPGAARWPLTFTVVSEDYAGEVTVQVDARVGSSAAPQLLNFGITGRAVASYRAREVVAVPINLWVACAQPATAAACATGTSCDRLGACVDARRTFPAFVSRHALVCMDGKVRRLDDCLDPSMRRNP